MASQRDMGDYDHVDIDSGDSDDDGLDYEDEEMSQPPAKDLFSDKVFKSVSECISEMLPVHGFDLKSFVKKHKMDCFSYIKFINFIRKEKPSVEQVKQMSDCMAWESDSFLKPVLLDDPLLMLDPDDILGNDDDCKFGDHIDNEDLPELVETDKDDLTEMRTKILSETENSVTLSKLEFNILQKQLECLKAKINQKDTMLSSCLEDMQKMKVATKNMFEDISESTDKKSNGVKSVSEFRKESEDQYYAGSYAHFGIHLEMLSDRIRTEAYRDAIMHNADSTINGKDVLDLGCGTGILSMFCAKAGAAKVVGVDMSEIIVQAMDIILENGFSETIQLIKGRLEDVTDLPVKKFDVIVSEWMGYFLLFEGMLDSVLSARDKYLKAGGKILPDKCSMHVVGVSDYKRYDETVTFWTDVYGFKMSCMKKPVLIEASIEIVPEESVATETALIHELDLNTCTIKDTEFETEFTLKATKKCDITAIAGYFDSSFNLSERNISFTTGPAGSPTHWKQTVFYLEDKIPVEKDEELRGHIKVKRPPKDARSLDVTITLNGKMSLYTLD